MQGDGRSHRIAVVADSVVNPPAGAPDELARLADQGWGVIALWPADLVPEARRAWCSAIVDQAVTFLDDGYQLALAGPVTDEVTAFVEALSATGHSLTERANPAE